LISPRSYAKKLSKSEDTVTKRLKAYLKEPNEANVHDLRTSIRRLLATADVLPKKMRKNDAKKYLANYKRLLRLNAKVRDLDIVLSKVSEFKDDPANKQLLKDLRKSRDSELKKAHRFASSIEEDLGFSLRASDLSGGSLRKRFNKSAGDLAAKIEERLPIVLKEPANKTELHELREDSRKLRYTLELENTSSASKLLTVLEAWQEVLGVIHDTDIFIMHFEAENDSPSMEPFLEREISGRNENYEKFRAIARESPSFRLTDQSS
jgi:CHAD domain-containing protein